MSNNRDTVLSMSPEKADLQYLEETAIGEGLFGCQVRCFYHTADLCLFFSMYKIEDLTRVVISYEIY